MSILKVNNSYFTGDDLNIPNMSSSSTGAAGAIAQANGTKLDRLINRLEPGFLELALGEELYLAFKAGMTVIDPIIPEQKWIDLAKYLVDTDLKVSSFANYVWFSWSRSNASSTTGNGEAIASKENAKSVSPIDHEVGVYIDMVDLLNKLRKYINANIALYPSYFPDEDFYAKINPFNF